MVIRTNNSTDVLSMKINLQLVKKELPKRKDFSAGFHEFSYYVRYVTSDGYLLAERQATEFDVDLIKKYGKESNCTLSKSNFNISLIKRCGKDIIVIRDRNI